jgi:hypothetical protein
MMPPTRSSTSTEASTYAFSPRELQRLAVYRAAVVARFYNEQCDSINAAEWAHAYDTGLSSQPDAN